MKLDTLASRIVEDHEIWLVALNGQVHATARAGSIQTLASVTEVRKWGKRTAGALSARISDELLSLLPSLGLIPETRAYAHAEALVHGFIARFADVMIKNINTAVEEVRKLEAGVGREMKRLAGGGLAELALKKQSRIEFKVPDPANRMWDANRYVSFEARELAYRLKLHVQLRQIVGDLAEVFNPDHEEDGMVFSITGSTPGYPALADILKTVFHPNSKAEIVQHATP